MARTWWVNQGSTYEQERTGGYVWAPTKTKAGHAVEHDSNVNRLQPGDTIIHYADGAIRAIGIVLNKPDVQQRPPELPSSAWNEEGYFARVQYHELAQPISLTDVPARTPEAGPFNRTGAVNQGYLYPLSPPFAARLHDTFRDRWPIPWLANEAEGNVWLFQANPDFWALEIEIPKIGVGREDTWSVSRHGSEMRLGDTVVIWKSGPRAGVYALAEITGPLTTRAGVEWRRKMSGETGPETVAPIRYTRYLQKPLLRTDLLKHPVISQMSVIRAAGNELQAHDTRVECHAGTAAHGSLG